jgi:hypothetical protein
MKHMGAPFFEAFSLLWTDRLPPGRYTRPSIDLSRKSWLTHVLKKGRPCALGVRGGTIASQVEGSTP